jgi:ABC-2 type transport system ATP-binding protein
MIRAVALTKDFATLRAVDALSFEAAAGEIYGLLGPNGAGKTTAMRLLAALLTPTSGTAEIAGYDVTLEAHAVRARIGILTEVPGLYTRLTPLEYLDFFAQIYGTPRPKARIEELLRLVGLWDRRQSVMRNFSKGMQQRVAIARALIQDPPVLLFDEPTAALDPEAARSVRDYLRDLAATKARTVLLCTHNLPEAEQLCHRLSIIQAGRQVAEGSPPELKARVGTTFVLRAATPALEFAQALQDVAEDVKVGSDGIVTFRTRHPARTNPAVIQAAVAHGVQVLTLAEAANALEEAYLALIAGTV